MAVHLGNGATQRLGSVDDEQASPIRFDASRDHFFQQALDYVGVLAGTVPKAEHVLVTIDIDAVTSELPTG